MYVCDVHTIIFTKLVLKYTVLDFFFIIYLFQAYAILFLTMLSGFGYFFGIVDTYRWYY